MEMAHSTSCLPSFVFDSQHLGQKIPQRIRLNLLRTTKVRSLWHFHNTLIQLEHHFLGLILPLRVLITFETAQHYHNYFESTLNDSRMEATLQNSEMQDIESTKEAQSAVPSCTPDTKVLATRPIGVISFRLMTWLPELRRMFYLAWLEAGPLPPLSGPWQYTYSEDRQFWTPWKLLKRDPTAPPGDATNAIVLQDPVLWNLRDTKDPNPTTQHENEILCIETESHNFQFRDRLLFEMDGSRNAILAFHAWKETIPFIEIADVRCVHVHGRVRVEGPRLKDFRPDLSMSETEPVFRIELNKAEDKVLGDKILVYPPAQLPIPQHIQFTRALRKYGALFWPGHKFDGRDLIHIVQIIGSVQYEMARSNTGDTWVLQATERNTCVEKLRGKKGEDLGFYRRLAAGYNPAADQKGHLDWKDYPQTIRHPHLILAIEGTLGRDELVTLEGREMLCTDCEMCGYPHTFFAKIPCSHLSFSSLAVNIRAAEVQDRLRRGLFV